MKDIEYICMELDGAAALINALGTAHELSRDLCAAAHHSVEEIILRAIEDLRAINK